MTRLWINQPGDYSGDTWHIAAALAASDDCSVIQTVWEEDEQQARRARKYYRDIGIDQSRVRMEVLKENAAQGLRLRDPRDRVAYNKRNVEFAAKNVELGTPGLVSYVYQATSVALAEILHDYQVRRKIAACLCSGFEKAHPQASECLRRLAAQVPARAVIIIGRYAKYYKPANASGAILEGLLECARQATRPSLLFGDTNNKCTVLHAEHYGLLVLDAYSAHPSYSNVCDTGLVDLRAVAYFWSTLAAMHRDVVIVGGRSGSTDSAAYMGLPVVEWDCFDATDPESLRLANMAPTLCSTLHVDTSLGLRVYHDYSRYVPGAPRETCNHDAFTVLKNILEDHTVGYGVIHVSDLSDCVNDPRPS